MVQGGLHQGVAVCVGSPGLRLAQPAPRLVFCHPPNPLHSLYSCRDAPMVGDRVRRCGGPRGPSGAGARRGHQWEACQLLCGGDAECELVKYGEAPKA